jgi:predicted PurR-regulated permease PerM
MMWNRQTIQNIVFFAVFILFFALVARLFFPFFTVILWAAILYILLNPLHVRLSGEQEAIKKGKQPRPVQRALSAGLLSVLAVLVLVTPLGILGIFLAGQTVGILGDILEFIDKAPAWISLHIPPVVMDTLVSMTDGALDPEHLDIRGGLVDFLQSNRKSLLGVSTSALKNIGSFALSLAFTTFTLYFFLMDGRFLLGLFVKAIPIKTEYMQILLQKFRESARQLVMGNLLVALIQGVVAFLLFTIFRIKGALLLGVLAAVCSFIPMVGAGAVWFPVSLYYILMRGTVPGIILLLLSALLISIADNFYRPILVGGPIKMHPLPIFFAIVGGVSLFGMNGLIIGPLILVMFFTVLDMFRDLYKISGEEA